MPPCIWRKEGPQPFPASTWTQFLPGAYLPWSCKTVTTVETEAEFPARSRTSTIT
jgi:hypothetical protein